MRGPWSDNTARRRVNRAAATAAATMIRTLIAAAPAFAQQGPKATFDCKKANVPA